jgi:hypothetical protein
VTIQEIEMQRLSILTYLIVTLLVLCASAMAQSSEPIGRFTKLEATLKPGSAHDYALRLARGESAEIVVHQQGVDVVVDVRNPADKLFDSIDSPTGRNGDEVIEIIAQESGTYGLQVRPYDNNEPPGSYRLEVRVLRGTRETADLLRTRREARSAATEWLRPRSVAIARSASFQLMSTLASWTNSQGVFSF